MNTPDTCMRACVYRCAAKTWCGSIVRCDCGIDGRRERVCRARRLSDRMRKSSGVFGNAAATLTLKRFEWKTNENEIFISDDLSKNRGKIWKQLFYLKKKIFCLVFSTCHARFVKMTIVLMYELSWLYRNFCVAAGHERCFICDISARGNRHGDSRLIVSSSGLRHRGSRARMKTGFARQRDCVDARNNRVHHRQRFFGCRPVSRVVVIRAHELLARSTCRFVCRFGLFQIAHCTREL